MTLSILKEEFCLPIDPKIKLSAQEVVEAVDWAVDATRKIDQVLIAEEIGPLAANLDLANLSSIIGNLVANKIASNNKAWERAPKNQHPDLIEPSQWPEMKRKMIVRRARKRLEQLELERQKEVTGEKKVRLENVFFKSLPEIPHVDGIEVKVALDNYHPKSHEAKANHYIIIKYVLETYKEEKSGKFLKKVRIHEIFTGRLEKSHFSDLSDRVNDAGKTAYIKRSSLTGNTMSRIYHDKLAAQCIRKEVPVEEEMFELLSEDFEPESSDADEVQSIVDIYLESNEELKNFVDKCSKKKKASNRSQKPKIPKCSQTSDMFDGAGER